MVGLGESKDEIIQVMDDLRAADVDFLTIGQYLQPTIKHHAVIDYITPELFDLYREIAISKGFYLFPHHRLQEVVIMLMKISKIKNKKKFID